MGAVSGKAQESFQLSCPNQDRLKGIKLGAGVAWHATAMVQAIDDKGLGLEMSKSSDGQVHLGLSSSPSREVEGATSRQKS